MDAGGLREVVASRSKEYLAELEALVNIDSGSFSPAGVNAVVDRCERRSRDDGWEVERRPHVPADGEAPLGDLLISRLHGAGGARVLLVGHTDTVFDDGTAAERPYRVDGSIARGPGVSDMKSGLLGGFFAVRALLDAGFETFDTITYVCNPDEEIGSPFSTPVIRELAAAHGTAFVLEGGRANGDIVSARKGITDFVIDVHGRAAHAGIEPEKGRNAIAVAADLVTRLQALHGRWPGVSVSVGTIRGGTRPNVVPAACRLEIDVRGVDHAGLAAAEHEIERLCREPSMTDVEVVLQPQPSFRPMEKTAAVAALVERAVRLADALGFELHDAATGGASDANTIAAAGVPVLDGLGPVGGDEHAPAEWLDLDSVVPRITVLAGLIGGL